MKRRSYWSRFGVVRSFSGGCKKKKQTCQKRRPVLVVKIRGPENGGLVVVVEIQGGQEGGQVEVVEGVGRRGARCRSPCRRRRLHGRHRCRWERERAKASATIPRDGWSAHDGFFRASTCTSFVWLYCVEKPFSFAHHTQNCTLTTQMLMKDATWMISFLGKTRLRASSLETTELQRRLCQEDNGPFLTQPFVQRCTQPCILLSPARARERDRSLAPKPQRIRACGHLYTATLVVSIHNPINAGSRRQPPPDGESDHRGLDAFKRGKATWTTGAMGTHEDNYEGDEYGDSTKPPNSPCNSCGLSRVGSVLILSFTRSDARTDRESHSARAQFQGRETREGRQERMRERRRAAQAREQEQAKATQDRKGERKAQRETPNLSRQGQFCGHYTCRPNVM